MKLIAVLLCLPCTAFAQETIDCDLNGPQIELNQCAYEDYQAADAELNDVYKKAVAALKEMDSYQEPKDQIGVKTLKEAQRAWITYRDLACEAEAFTFFGGTAAPMVHSGCMAAITRARTEDLRRIADIGDL